MLLSLPMMEPGGREAGMSALTGASTILILLRRVSLLYLQKSRILWNYLAVQKE
jgi:hypothetical protein